MKNKLIIRKICIAFIILSSVSIGSCGYKGDLYVPNKNAKTINLFEILN
jgi:predicted small lipoprotein YifL